jgi:EAL domain-containing protein (putative c-di-GMP-specific phosphodiesterase class I)
MGLSVVAEGVETAEQAALVRRLGCDELQGYHFAKPMPIEALRRVVLGWSA